MANFVSHQNNDFVSDLLTFFEGSPTFKLVDIVNDGSRPNVELVGNLTSKNWQATKTQISVRHAWNKANMGSYVYDFEYFVNPNALQNFDVLAMRVEIFVEEPNASLATNQTQTTMAYENNVNNSAWAQAKSGDSNATDENLSSFTEPIMTFESPMYQDNNYVGAKSSVTYEGNFVEGRDGSGKFKLSQHTRKAIVKPKQQKVFFAHPYVTDDDQQLARLYYGNPDYVVPTDSQDVKSNDGEYQPADPSTLDRGDLPATAEVVGSELNTATLDSPGASDPFKRVDPGDLIALNNIVERISLREARDTIKKLRPTIVDARDKKFTKALVDQVVPPGVTAQVGGLLGYTGMLETDVHSVRMEVEIPKFLLDSRLPQSLDPEVFHVRMTPIVGPNAAKGTVATPMTFSVSHKKQVQDMMIPVFPPEIKLVKVTATEVTVAARGVDPTTVGIAFSYAVKRPAGSNAPTGDFKKIAALGSHVLVNANAVFASDPLSFHNFVLPLKEFEIPAVAPNSLVIRATAGGIFGLLPAGTPLNYSEVTVECAESAHQPMVIPHVTISAINNRDGIAITVTNIPDSVLAIRLMRDELDESGSLRDRSKVVPNKKGLRTVPASESIVYADRAVDHRRRYRYYCILTVRKPGSIISHELASASDCIIERTRTVKEPPFVPSIVSTSAAPTGIGNTLGVNITLAIKSRPDSVNLLIDLLEKAGINQPFVDAVQKQTEDAGGFQDLVSFTGTRVDLHTGEREYLGIIPPGLFVDNRGTQVASGRKPLYAGRRYQYIFNLVTRPVQSFLQKVEQFLPSNKVPGDPDLKVTAKKFVNIYSENFGALPSTHDLNRQSISSQLELGYTGISISQQFTMPELPLKITNVSVSYEDKEKTRAVLKWKLRGDRKMRGTVDGFRVYVTYRDQTAICGKVDCNPDLSEFGFREAKYAPEVGDKVYFVVPIMLDGKQGAPSTKVRLMREHTIPPALLAPNISFKLIGATSVKEGAFKKVGQVPLVLNKNAQGPNSADLSPKVAGIQQQFNITPPPPASAATNPSPTPAGGTTGGSVAGNNPKLKTGPTF